MKEERILSILSNFIYLFVCLFVYLLKFNFVNEKKRHVHPSPLVQTLNTSMYYRNAAHCKDLYKIRGHKELCGKWFST